MSKKFEINYLPIAKNDLEEIIEYIQKDSPAIALDFLNKIDKTISQLSDFPYMGAIPKNKHLQSKGYRMLIIKNYLIFYVVYDNIQEIEIRRILHGKRKYKFLL